MFLLTLAFVLIVYIIIGCLHFIYDRDSLNHPSHIELHNIPAALLDAAILSCLLYFIAMHIADLQVGIAVDFYNLGAITAGLLVSFGYVTYVRNLVLYAWPTNRKDTIYDTDLSQLKKKYKICSGSYRLQRILYIPLINTVLIGKRQNRIVPVNQIKLLSNSEIIFFRRVIYQRTILFSIFLLFFIPSLYILKRAFPTPEGPLFSLFLIFWSATYFQLNSVLSGRVRTKADFTVYTTNPEEYCKALENYRLSLLPNARKNTAAWHQNDISVRILKLRK